MAFKTNDQQINESIRARHNPLMKCCHSGNTHTVRILLSLTSLALHVAFLYTEELYGRNWGCLFQTPALLVQMTDAIDIRVYFHAVLLKDLFHLKGEGAR